MILWTILREKAYHLLTEQGHLHYLDEWLEKDEDFCYWNTPFLWMAEHLRIKAGDPPEGVKYPLWAWHQWDGAKRPRPDLRSGSIGTTGTVAYRVEFEIDPNDVILSDFSTWSCVLNGWHLPWNEADYEDFDARLKKAGLSKFVEGDLPEPWQSEIRQSWLRVFDLSHSDTYITEPMEKKEVQACYWQLRAEQIRKVDRFVCR